jgi:hypothetical protein
MNFYYIGIGNLKIHAMGLPPEFSSRYNGIMVCYCDTLQAGMHMNHDTQLIKINDTNMQGMKTYNMEVTLTLPLIS